MARLTDEQLKRYVVDEILRAAESQNVTVQELSRERIAELRYRLSEKHGVDPDAPLTFQNMRNKAAIQDPEGWRRLSDFLAPTAHVMFYDAPGYMDRAGVEFPDGSRITSVLAECFGFPFYVTDAAASFVVGCNEHDFLIGVGTAAEWITRL